MNSGTAHPVIGFHPAAPCPGVGNAEELVTASILLIRHAAHSHLGSILSGRTPGIALSETGRAQAARLAQALASEPIDCLQSSPVQRARETAAAVAARHPGLAVETCPALDELDFGDWSGRAFTELADDPRWSGWNAQRSAARAPGGESMAEAQARAWAHVEAMAAARPGARIAMVSHCDVIRALVARVLDLSLDRLLRFDIEPASVSRLAVGPWGAKLTGLNEVC